MQIEMHLYNSDSEVVIMNQLSRFFSFLESTGQLKYIYSVSSGSVQAGEIIKFSTCYARKSILKNYISLKF